MLRFRQFRHIVRRGPAGLVDFRIKTNTKIPMYSGNLAAKATLFSRAAPKKTNKAVFYRVFY
jgi:hypothetical protein